jgi:hypothetical protein
MRAGIIWFKQGSVAVIVNMVMTLLVPWSVGISLLTEQILLPRTLAPWNYLFAGDACRSFREKSLHYN